MAQLKLSTLAVVLGLGLAGPQIYGLLNPAAFRAAVRKFPRSKNWGYALVALATVWFLWLLKNESIADFEPYKPVMLGGFALVGVLTCIYVSDFLAVRGFAVVAMLLAKLMLDTQRWVGTDWRLVIALWGYLLAILGIWFTVSPWRMRDLLDWATASDQRVRVGSALRLAFGLFVAALGLTVF